LSAGTQLEAFVNALEKSKDQKDRQWAEKRLQFLPGTGWPELWVVTQKSEAACARLVRELSLSLEKVHEVLDAARRAGKHNEFYEAARMLNLDTAIVAHQLIKAAFESVPAESQRLSKYVQDFLE